MVGVVVLVVEFVWLGWFVYAVSFACFRLGVLCDLVFGYSFAALCWVLLV